MNKKRIILGNAPLINANKGCLALTLSTLYVVQQIFDNHGVECEFFLPQSGLKTSKTSCMSISGTEIQYACLRDLMLWDPKTRLLHLVKYKDFSLSKSAYKEADYLLDLGQGDSFSDIYGVKRFNWINNSYLLAQKHQIKYCVLPQTIGPFASASIRNKAVQSLSQAELLFARDKQSSDYIYDIYPQARANETIDMAFFLPYTRHNFDSKNIHVGLNVSALIWNGGYEQNNQFGLCVDYQQLVFSIIEYFTSLSDVVVHLVPHVVSDGEQLENDYLVSMKIYESINKPNLILSPFFRDPVEAKNYISGMDFFVGSRMHATIGAFSSGVPVYPLAYSRKFNGLFIDTLSYEAMGDMKTQSDKDLLENIKTAFNNRQDLKRIIESRLSGVVAERKKIIIDELTKFFGL